MIPTKRKGGSLHIKQWLQGSSMPLHSLLHFLICTAEWSSRHDLMWSSAKCWNQRTTISWKILFISGSAAEDTAICRCQDIQAALNECASELEERPVASQNSLPSICRLRSTTPHQKNQRNTIASHSLLRSHPTWTTSGSSSPSSSPCAAIKEHSQISSSNGSS